MRQIVAQAGLTVMIGALKDGALTFLGSGFVCDQRGYILTCAHVLNLTAKLQAVMPPPIDSFAPLTAGQVSPFPLTVVQIDAENDVALLKPNDEITAHLSENLLGRGEVLSVGEEVGCLGVPFGGRGLHTLKLTRTTICGKSVSHKGSKRLHLDANLHEGNSGGPVISASSGQIIGLVAERFSPVGTTGAGVFVGGMALGSDSTISFAIPIEYGLRLMAEEGLSNAKL